MAISARSAALRERRTPYARRKVLSPGSLRSGASSIARKMADAEFESMVDRYSEGLVSNQDMYSYLQRSLSSDLFTPNEKVDIQARLLDFEGRIQGDALKAQYDLAEGQEKVDAALALSNFYQTRSATMQPGTPAQSNAFSEVAKWQSTAQSLTTQLQKDQRKLSRAAKLYDLSLLPPDDVDSLEKTAQVYLQLSQEAQADGDMAEAYELGTKANQIMNDSIPSLQQKNLKDELTNALQQIKNQYHDGQLSALDAAGRAKEIDEVAMEAGLYEMASSVNEFADSLHGDIQKGTVNGDINGLPFSVRKSGNEYTATVKQWKERFALEDDTFNQLKREIEKDPVAVTRMEKMIRLYSGYMTGMYSQGEEADEFMGMQGRMDAYQTWNDNTDADYTNEIRDTQTKLTTLGDKLAQITYQYASLSGADADEMLNYVFTQVLPESSQFTPGAGAGSTGVLIKYDDFGNEYEEPITLNAQMQTTDSAGNPVIQGTYLGRDIAQTQDGRYVKLQPYFSTEAARSANIPDFYYAVYNGQYWVKGLGDEQMKPASEAAVEDENIAFWYSTVQDQDQQMQARWAQIQQERGVLEPGAGQLPIQPALPELSQQELVSEPALPEPTVKYDTPLPNLQTAAPRGIAAPNFTSSPAQDFNVGASYPSITPQPVSNYTLPPLTVTPTTQRRDIQPQNQLYNAGALPPNNLQNAGLNINLGQAPNTNNLIDTLPPVQSPTQKKPGLLENAWNWLRGLF